MHSFSSPGTAAEATNNFRRSQFRRLQRAESTQSGPVREIAQGAAARGPAATRGSALCDPMICACGSALRRAYRPDRRRGRVAEGGGLLNRYRLVKAYRGLESLRLLQTTCVSGPDTRRMAWLAIQASTHGALPEFGGIRRKRECAPFALFSMALASLPSSSEMPRHVDDKSDGNADQEPKATVTSAQQSFPEQGGPHYGAVQRAAGTASQYRDHQCMVVAFLGAKATQFAGAVSIRSSRLRRSAVRTIDC